MYYLNYPRNRGIKCAYTLYFLPTYGPDIVINQFTDILTATGKIEYDGYGQINLIKVVNNYVQGALQSPTTRISVSLLGFWWGGIYSKMLKQIRERHYGHKEILFCMLRVPFCIISRVTKYKIYYRIRFYDVT